MCVCTCVYVRMCVCVGGREMVGAGRGGGEGLIQCVVLVLLTLGGAGRSSRTAALSQCSVSHDLTLPLTLISHPDSLPPPLTPALSLAPFLA